MHSFFVDLGFLQKLLNCVWCERKCLLVVQGKSYNNDWNHLHMHTSVCSTHAFKAFTVRLFIKHSIFIFWISLPSLYSHTGTAENPKSDLFYLYIILNKPCTWQLLFRRSCFISYPIKDFTSDEEWNLNTSFFTAETDFIIDQFYSINTVISVCSRSCLSETVTLV